MAFDPFTSGSDVPFVFALNPAWATAWRDGTTANNGMLLKAAVEDANKYFVFRSTEHTAAFRPWFEIDVLNYTPSGSTGNTPRGGDVVEHNSYEDADAQNQWISALQLGKMGLSWKNVGRKAVVVYGLGDEFDGLMGHYRSEKESEERACKLALRDLQVEYGLDFVNDGRK